MGRPRIDDEAVLMEIAIALVRQPEASFASVFRQIELPQSVHSSESARARLQRKFRENPSQWLNRARRALLDHQVAQFLEFIALLDALLKRAAEKLLPLMQAADEALRRSGLSLANVHGSQF